MNMADARVQNNNNVNNNNNNRDPLVAVRDRLFHSLFFKISLAYARGCPRPVRRVIEMLILLKAILCFLCLVYVHVAFSRHPVQCLEHIKDSWPRDGILRVEIIKNSPENYSVEQSYEKEHNLQFFQHQNEELFFTLFGVFASGEDSISYTSEYSTVADVEEDDDEEEKEETEDVEDEDLTEGIFNETLLLELARTDSKTGSNGSSDLLNGSNSGEIVGENIDILGESKTEKSSKSHVVVWPEEVYIVEYSFEYGFLRLSPETRQKLNISVQIAVLDPTKDKCFGDTLSHALLQNLIGYDEVLMSSIKSLAENEDNKGFLRNVVTGSHYHFVSRWTSSSSYFVAALVMMVFTVSISMLLRYSQHQIFVFIVELLQMLEFNTNISFPAAPLLTVVLALVGMESIMSEFFEDTTTAFYVILIVWVADQYDAICCHRSITKKYWPRFFYLYHLSFYAYHYRFGGQYSGLALLTTWLFTQHSMVYFFHHYELPVILQQAQIQDILMRNQENGGPPLRVTHRVNNNGVQPRQQAQQQPQRRELARGGAFNFAGFRFRFGVVLTTPQQNHPHHYHHHHHHHHHHRRQHQPQQRVEPQQNDAEQASAQAETSNPPSERTSVQPERADTSSERPTAQDERPAALSERGAEGNPDDGLVHVEAGDASRKSGRGEHDVQTDESDVQREQLAIPRLEQSDVQCDEQSAIPRLERSDVQREQRNVHCEGVTSGVEQTNTGSKQSSLHNEQRGVQPEHDGLQRESCNEDQRNQVVDFADVQRSMKGPRLPEEKDKDDSCDQGCKSKDVAAAGDLFGNLAQDEEETLGQVVEDLQQVAEALKPFAGKSDADAI